MIVSLLSKDQESPQTARPLAIIAQSVSDEALNRVAPDAAKAGIGFIVLSPEWLHVPFTGCDGLPESGQRLVNEKLLAATVVLQSNAGPAVDLIAAHLKGGTIPPARVVLSPKPFPTR